MSNIDVYIGIGSNLANPVKQVETAILELAELNATNLLGSSPLYRSKPAGPQDQPDFINAAARLSTQLSPIALLDELQNLEERHERKRLKHWGPRTLDLDILLYGSYIINEPRLTVPHPYMLQRNFVLVPLFHLMPDLILPCGNSLATIMPGIDKEGLDPL